MKDILDNKQILFSIENSLKKNIINNSLLAKKRMKSKTKFHFTLIENILIENLKSIQSIFVGVVFRNCTIVKCDFSRCDFEGVSFENCNIKDTSFNDTDIRTVNFTKSRILTCSFQNSTCLDNYFIRCILNNCTFNGSTVSRCSFDNSILNKITETQISTWLHAKFNKCSIRYTNFFDCTFSYGIFKNCKLKNMALNADSLGLTFGLTLENLTKINYGFLGSKFEEDIDINIQNFLKSYHEQGWGIQFYILSINLYQSTKINLFINLFKFIHEQIQYKVGPTKDDLEFVHNIMIELYKKSSLPFCAVLEIKNSLLDIQESFIQNELINIVHQNLLLLSTNMSDKLLNHITPLLKINANNHIKVEFVFSEKPIISIIKLFSILASDTKCILGENRLLGTRKGSWIEILSAPIGNIIALTIFIYAINGVLVALNTVKRNSKELLSLNIENKPQSIAIKSTPKNITSYISEINKLLTKGNEEEIKKVYKSLKKLDHIDMEEGIE